MKRSFALIMFIVVVRLFTLFVLPLMDPSEPRYALVAREMADSGDWVTPKVWIDGKLIPYLGKPPLYFWFTAICIQFFKANEFSLRLPSFLSAILLIALMGVVVWRYIDHHTAVLSAILTCSSAFFFVGSGLVTPDMALTLCVSGAILACFAFDAETRKIYKKLWSLLVFALLGAGFLTKGPVALILFGIPVCCWTLLHRKREVLKEQAWVFGIFIFLVITVPWYLIAEMRTPGFLKYFFLNENLLRYTTHNYSDRYGYGHLFPYGSAVVMLFLSCLPWTLYAPIKLFRGPQKKEILSFYKDHSSGLFFLGFVGITFFWCFSRQLLVSYLLPAVPLFSVWLAMMVKRTGISVYTIQIIAIATVIIYGTGCLVGQPFLSRSFSTKEIINIACKKADQLKLKKSFVVVRKTPYSAYFYGGDHIIPHPKETVLKSVLRGLNSGNDYLYIIKKRYVKRIPREVLRKLNPLDAYGSWTLFRAMENL